MVNAQEMEIEKESQTIAGAIDWLRSPADTQMMLDTTIYAADNATEKEALREDEVDLEEFNRFIKILCGDSPVTIQTFDDDKDRNDKALSKIKHNLTAENLPALIDLNKRGACISVMVNQSDGKGRKTSNVVNVRAAFVDHDGSPLQPVLDSMLKPHLITESSHGRYHSYWFVNDCHLSRFSSLQLALAEEFKGDTSVTDLPRTMRVAGFFHNKDKNKPFRTRIVQHNDIPPYTVNEIVSGLGLVEKVRTLRQPVIQSYDLSRAENALKHLVASTLPYDQWRNVGYALHHAFGVNGFELFDSWSRLDSARYDGDIQSFWDSIKDTGSSSITIGTLFKMAKDSGWKTAPDYIEDMNENHFVAQEGGKVSIYCEENDPVFDRQVLHRLSFPDFKNLYDNVNVLIGTDRNGNPEYGKLGTAWTQSSARRQYSGVVMAPNTTIPDKYNLWRGFPVQPIHGSWQTFNDLIFNIICAKDIEAYDYVIGWMARMVQHPELVGEVAVVLQGGRGIGKSKFGNWLCRLS